MLRPWLRTFDSYGDEDCTKSGASLSRRGTVRRRKNYESQHAIWRRSQTSVSRRNVSETPDQRPHDRSRFSGPAAPLAAHQSRVRKGSSSRSLSHFPRESIDLGAFIRLLHRFLHTHHSREMKDKVHAFHSFSHEIAIEN